MLLHVALMILQTNALISLPCLFGFLAFSFSKVFLSFFRRFPLISSRILDALNLGLRKALQPDFGAYRGLARVFFSPSNSLELH